MSTAVAKRESAEVGVSDRQMEAIQRVLSQRTPESEIRVRDDGGGRKYKYTDGAYVIRTLNEAFGWDWDFVADSEELLLNNGFPFEVKVRGTLTVRMGGRTLTKTQYGSQPIKMKTDGKSPVSIGDCYKGAATDAMKKCASLLGIALDLYDSDYKAEKYTDQASSPRTVYDETGAEPYDEPEPVRAVRLEGAQPKADTGTQWPAHRKYAPIFGKCQALKFSPVDMANYIQLKFKLAVSDDPVTALDGLSDLQLRELDQALAGEFNNRSRTR